MDIYIFIIAWIFAVLGMTGFSAIITYILGWELREHYLLTKLAHTINSKNSKRPPSVLIGWVIHFFMGLFFLAFYEFLWWITDMERSLSWSLVFGMLMGVLGILGWMAMFKMHPNPPVLHFKTFYLQLFFAHIVFSVIAFVVYIYLSS